MTFQNVKTFPSPQEIFAYIDKQNKDMEINKPK